jgi:hypothetical protein
MLQPRPQRSRVRRTPATDVLRTSLPQPTIKAAGLLIIPLASPLRAHLQRAEAGDPASAERAYNVRAHCRPNEPVDPELYSTTLR